SVIIPRGYDILGNIVIVKFDRKTKVAQKKKWALAFLNERKQVKTVLEKSNKFRGRLRTLTTKFIEGVKTKEVLYRENGCEFRFNTDSCYFSPRLSSERKEIADLVKKNEEVLVLFGGVGPFAIVIAKTGKSKKVVSVELGRECSKYALENVKRNKLENKVEIIQGDVRRILPKINRTFDRVVMTRPNLKDSFLEVSFPRVKKGGIIHYYGFYREVDLDKMKEMIEKEAKKAERKIKILGIKKAGDIGVRTFRYRVDIKVLK
ncbi:MAG: hypothetical protein AABX66_03255, partial [Nanoarchaeota archaeon]